MSDALADVLVANHRAFLGFLERRLGDRALAEDVLQDAFIRGLPHAARVEEEALVPWFYRVLRNAVIDQHRRRGAAARALDAFAAELTEEAPPPDVAAALCGGVTRLAATLKPEYPGRRPAGRGRRRAACEGVCRGVRHFGLQRRGPPPPGPAGPQGPGGRVLRHLRGTRLPGLLLRQGLTSRPV